MIAFSGVSHRKVYTCTLHGQPKRTCLLCHPVVELATFESAYLGEPQRQHKSYEQKVFEAFAGRVTMTESCWLWTGGKTLRNYGVFCVRAWRIWAAHRYAYHIFNGPLLDGMVLDHLCKNTLCVNPRHIEQVTQQENSLRGNSRKVCPHGVRGKTHCPDCKSTYLRARRIRNGLPVRNNNIGRSGLRHTAINMGKEMLAQLRQIAAQEGHHSVSRVIRLAVIRQYQLDAALNNDGRSKAS